jgi:hypothetical protein
MISLDRILSGLLALLMLVGVAGVSHAKAASASSLRGTVESGGTGLEGYEVSLYASFVRPFGRTSLLGRDTTGPSGEFRITYRLASMAKPLLFVRAERGPAMLASAIGQAHVPGPVTVNERTTIATGFAFAQFVRAFEITGNRYGMLNAVHMAANMASPETADVAPILRLPPNGPETTALLTFNSLANIVAWCITTEIGCEDLFDATTLPGGVRPTTVLQAVANIAK